MRLQFPEGSAYNDSGPVFRIYVLHEFGHTLGVQHEHQRVNCEFDYKFIMQNIRYESLDGAKKQLAHILEFLQSAYSGWTYTSTEWDNMSVNTTFLHGNTLAPTIHASLRRLRKVNEGIRKA